jgi:hypothetical protein
MDWTLNFIQFLLEVLLITVKLMNSINMVVVWTFELEAFNLGLEVLCDVRKICNVKTI